MTSELFGSVFGLIVKVYESLKDGKITLGEAEGLLVQGLSVAAAAKGKEIPAEELKALVREIFEAGDAFDKLYNLLK